MTLPKCKVDVYHAGTLLRSFTDEVMQAQTTEVLTDNVGSFSFTVPARTGVAYENYDVSLYDEARIYFGYDSLPSSPTFIGYIMQIDGTMQDTCTRTFTGKSKGEVLTRRLKSRYFYDLHSDVLAAEVATDLSLGTSLIANEDQHEIQSFDNLNYLEVLKYISDYWVDATHQVKMDFYVDTSGNLVWKALPFRSGAAVESFTVGDNINSYSVHRDITPVKNSITVYGNKSRFEPTTKDGWCEAVDANWHIATGDSLTTDGAEMKVGVGCVKATDTDAGGPTRITFNYVPTVSVYCGAIKNGFDHLHLWFKYQDDLCANYDLRLCNAAGAHYWVLDLGDVSKFPQVNPITLNTWYELDIPVGPNAPTNYWFATGVTADDWNDPIQRIEFDVLKLGAGTVTMFIDEMYFHTQRFYCATQQDATSIAAYGQRDLVYTDDKLISDAECLARARALKNQLKDPSTRIDLVVNGNTNVLIGDRLSLTIPQENITATNYDVMEVKHYFTQNPLRFNTAVASLSTGNLRELPPVSKDEVVVQSMRNLKRLREANLT